MRLAAPTEPLSRVGPRRHNIRRRCREQVTRTRTQCNCVPQSYTFKAVITVIVTGLVGAAWLGLKVMLGK